MRAIKALLAVAVLGFALLVTAAPSQGHDVIECAVHSGGATGCVKNHNRMYVCDWQVDGHKAWLRYDTYWPNPQDQFFGYAPSGGCLPATGWAGTNLGMSIGKFVVCIQTEGCTPVHYP